MAGKARPLNMPPNKEMLDWMNHEFEHGTRTKAARILRAMQRMTKRSELYYSSGSW